MTKSEIIEKLIASGIEFDESSNKAELEALLPEEDAEDTVNAPVSKGKKTEVTVTWKGGSRVYSKEVHGDDFADLANEFATKKKGTVA